MLIPGGRKIVMLYRRTSVSAGGLFAGGIYFDAPRSPAAAISGPRQLAIEEGATALSRTYATDDLVDLRPPLRYQWTGNAILAPSTDPGVTARFDLNGTKAGDVVASEVRLRLTDADGLVAETAASVRIHVVPGPDQDDGLPLICKKRPWLPQCQPVSG